VKKCGSCGMQVFRTTRNEIRVSVGHLFWSFCSVECFDRWAREHGRFSVLAAEQVIDGGALEERTR